MTNYENYCQTFRTALQLEKEDEIETINYMDASWDSVGHMILMAKIENTFKIIFETDDLFTFHSFKKGIEILRKYGVEL